MPQSLLLVTHVPVRRNGTRLLIDSQTARGISQWCRYFDRVTYIGIEDAVPATAGSAAWVDLSLLPEAKNCELIALASGYHVAEMLRVQGAVRDRLRQAVSSHDHLCFTIGGLVGDWPAIGALEAIKQGRDFVAWIDRVEPEIIRLTMAQAPLRRRLKNLVVLPLMERFQRYILSRSKVALLQGMDTFDYFGNSAPNPHCIYDTHTTKADRITPQTLARKQAKLQANAPLKIIYIGRAAPMKGTEDWLDTLAVLAQRGVPFEARWIGDGPDLPAMQDRIDGSALEGKVVLSGFEADRQVVLQALQDSDILLFCHKTPESPRCLIEALVSGCPLVGYRSAYVSGLVEMGGGAALSPLNDVDGLAATIEKLHLDRDQLATLMAEASASGMQYDEDSVYAHRANLMMSA